MRWREMGEGSTSGQQHPSLGGGLQRSSVSKNWLKLNQKELLQPLLTRWASPSPSPG